MPTFHSNGTLGLRFGIGGLTCTAWGSFWLQSGEVTFDGETYIVKDASGTTVLVYNFDEFREGTFEYKVQGAAATISASTTAPGFGATMTTVSSIDAHFTGSNLICMGSTVKQSNTEAAVVTVKWKAWPNVTN